uniref:NADH dehydrogenase subunit 4 n=1 Tax=Strongylodon macrobotrys TaxID=167626 RepID=UPI0022042F63|nr:NADH dehydrogenase subunit 4 [Strongylodon macrobotrys]UXL85843.1 NADH dehydrogenase subunit 4 [Strongylodon macrobotrys]
MNYFPWLTTIVVLPIVSGSLIFLFPHKGNKVIKWYTICICLIDLLLTAYVFCYHFELDDPLIQFTENSKWIHFFLLLLEIRNRRTLSRTHFIDGIYHYFSYISGSARYSKIKIILFPDVSNVYWSNRNIFFSRHFTFFHLVGIRINSHLSTFIYVGWKKTFVFSYKVYFVHCGKFCFFYYWEFWV